MMQGEAIRATQVGAIANLLLAGGKGFVGVAVGSTGLIADGVNSLGDLFSDAVVWYTVVESRKQASPERPWGRGKFEPLGALTVGALLLTTGLGIGYSSLAVAVDMGTQFMPALDNVHFLFNIGEKTREAFETTAPAIDPNMMYVALGVSCTGVAVKEALYHYTMRAGKNANSAAVIANAEQHRADVIVSSAVSVGLIGTLVGIPVLDPLAGTMVAGVIIRTAYTTAVRSLRDLSDVPAGEVETQNLVKECLKVPGIRTVESLHARLSGPYLYVECNVGVDGTITASAAHRLGELARKQMIHGAEGRVANAVVHVDPLGSAGLGENSPPWARDHDSVESEVEKALAPLFEPNGITGVSEVQIYYRDDGSVAVKVDVFMSPDLTIKAAHSLAQDAKLQIESALPGVGEVDIDLELDEDNEL
jgi:cation diffusion facilitator family transporter